MRMVNMLNNNDGNNNFDEVVDLLKKIRLPALAEAFSQQILNVENYEGRTFTDRLLELVQAEYDAEVNNRIARLKKSANIPICNAHFSEIEYKPERQINREIIKILATNKYIEQKLNVLIQGETGCGKSFIASCLANAACEAGIKTKFIRLQKLFREFDTARGLGCYNRVLEQYQKVPVLVLDDFLLTPTSRMEQTDLLELIEGLCGTASTIFCSQFAAEGWHATLDGGVLADSILDRIIPSAYKIKLAGDSMRRLLSII